MVLPTEEIYMTILYQKELNKYRGCRKKICRDGAYQLTVVYVVGHFCAYFSCSTSITVISYQQTGIQTL